MDFFLKINKKYDFVFIFLSLFFALLYFINFHFLDIEKNNKNEDIVFILDVSKSMNVVDYKDFSRLEIAKKIIKNHIKKAPNNRYSLVVFAWTATSVFPLSSDINLFNDFLENVDNNSVLKQWTNFYSAIKLGISRLNINELNTKNIIILSDGSDEDLNSEQIKNLKLNSTNIFIIWIWTVKWGKIPEQKTTYWDIIYKRYSWEEVVSKINTDFLDKLSKTLKWKTFLFPEDINTDFAIEKLNNQIINEQKNITDNNSNKNLFFIYLSFIMFLFYLFSYIFTWRKF